MDELNWWHYKAKNQYDLKIYIFNHNIIIVMTVIPIINQYKRVHNWIRDIVRK